MLVDMAKKNDYPDRIVNLMATLQRALYDNADDNPVEADEDYNLFLPETITVLRERFIGASYLLNGFNVYSKETGDVVWRAVWGPFYPENFLIQVVTGRETRPVWKWTKLSRVPTEFYTYETVRRYDEFSDWESIESALQGALASYHEWKSSKLAVA
jgi:hypothetical protein